MTPTKASGCSSSGTLSTTVSSRTRFSFHVQTGKCTARLWPGAVGYSVESPAVEQRLDDPLLPSSASMTKNTRWYKKKVAADRDGPHSAGPRATAPVRRLQCRSTGCHRPASAQATPLPSAAALTRPGGDGPWPGTTAPARAGPQATAPVRARRRPAAAAAVGGDSVAARELAAHVMSATNGRARARARLVAAACFAAAAASDAPGTPAAGAADPRHAAAEGGRRLPQPKPTGPTQLRRLLPCPCCRRHRCHTPVEGRGR